MSANTRAAMPARARSRNRMVVLTVGALGAAAQLQWPVHGQASAGEHAPAVGDRRQEVALGGVAVLSELAMSGPFEEVDPVPQHRQHAGVGRVVGCVEHGREGVGGSGRQRIRVDQVLGVPPLQMLVQTGHNHSLRLVVQILSSALGHVKESCIRPVVRGMWCALTRR